MNMHNESVRFFLAFVMVIERTLINHNGFTRLPNSICPHFPLVSSDQEKQNH
jgi:hypothetical protein